jgi:HAD superfamily hydrolase (TIGR01509 family)
MIQAVIFDMDGLMFDTESAYSIVQSEMWRKRGMIFTNEVKRRLMGKRAHEVMNELNRIWGRNEDIEDLLREQDVLLVETFNTSVEKLKGLDDLILFLNKNSIRKCIGTSSRRFLADLLLKKFNLENEFEFIVTGDMVQKGKPDPELYNLCVLKLGILPEESLVLEDSLNGVKAGLSAGCKVGVIPSEYTKSEDFSSAHIICDSLGDRKLKEFILGN